MWKEITTPEIICCLIVVVMINILIVGWVLDMRSRAYRYRVVHEYADMFGKPQTIKYSWGYHKPYADGWCASLQQRRGKELEEIWKLEGKLRTYSHFYVETEAFRIGSKTDKELKISIAPLWGAK